MWISPDPDGHLLATGVDAKGRKQYRYHPAYRRRRDDRKYERIAAFGASLPRLRRQVAADLRRHGLPREKVVAAVVALLDETSLRVGNERYARENRSYGLTTLLARHARHGTASVRLRFRGKSGHQYDVGLRDRRLASVVRRCQELPGQRLFRYEDAETGTWQAVMSDDVNAYIRAAIGDEFSAKDFRTWHGTLAAFEALAGGERPTEPRRRAAAVVAAVDEAADQLGNTRAVARQAYVHPAIDRAFQAGAFPGGRSSPVPDGGGRARPSCCVCSPRGPRPAPDDSNRPPAKMGGPCGRSTGSTARSTSSTRRGCPTTSSSCGSRSSTR